MYCNKCGKWNNDTSKFCINCGHSLEKITFVQPLNTNVQNKEQLSNSTLSIISLILFIGQFVSSFIVSKIEVLSFLSSVPWLPASLVLAIISKCKYNDKLSLIMIIIDIIFIVLAIILVIIAMFLFATALEMLLTGCSGIPA